MYVCMYACIYIITHRESKIVIGRSLGSTEISSYKDSRLILN